MSIWQDVRHGWRMWSRHPGFAAVVVLTLALGIGANTAMFSILHEALLKPLPFRDPGRLVLVSTTFGGDINPLTSLPDYYDLRDQASSYEALDIAYPVARKTTLTGNGRPEFVAAMPVSTGLFGMLGVATIAGRWFTPDEGKAGAPYVALIGQGLARRRFGSPAQAVGRQLALGGIAPGTVSATVVGVVPASFRLFDDAEVWVPVRRGEGDSAASRRFHNWMLVGRLKAGVSMERARGEADLVGRRLRQQYPDSNLEMGFHVASLQAGLFRKQTPSLVVLMLAVGMVLLIACANVAGLLLARGALRRPELAVRAALGGSRRRIAGQLLAENLTLALASGVAGMALACWLQRLLPMVTGLAGLGVAPTRMEWPVLWFALGASLATGLLFGLIPALRASSPRLAENLTPGFRTTQAKGGLRLRAVLVVSQVAVSLVLLAGAGLLVRSLTRLAGTNLGFDSQHLLTGEIQVPDDSYPPERRPGFFAALQSDIAAIPGVTAVGFIDQLPIRHPSGNYPMWPADRPPKNPSEERTANLRLVLPGYFDALRIPLLAGRDLTKGDRKGTPLVMVVTERMAGTLFPGRRPLGQRVTVMLGAARAATFEVVGVVGDARIDAVGQPARMTMYAAYDQVIARPRMRFAVRSGLAPGAIAASVRKVAAARDPDVPVDNLVSMEQLIGDSLVPERLTAITLALFAAVAMLLAAIGLYGTLAFWVTQRMHEIGIRLALGAQRRDILRLIVGQGMRLAITGAAIGAVACLGMNHLMRGMIYGIGPYDPVTFTSVVVLLTSTAAAACYLPARRGSRADPVTTLRLE
jgi:putative ABC transport system permease protein